MTEVARQLNAVEGEAEGREEKEDETGTKKRMARRGHPFCVLGKD